MTGLPGMIQGLKIAGDAMWVQTQRMLISAQNIANADSKASTPGGEPYARKTIFFQSYFDRKRNVQTVRIGRIGRDKTPFPTEYLPNDPAADEQGFVKKPNVRPMVEMADIREAKYSISANAKAFESILAILRKYNELMNI